MKRVLNYPQTKEQPKWHKRTNCRVSLGAQRINYHFRNTNYLFHFNTNLFVQLFIIKFSLARFFGSLFEWSISSMQFLHNTVHLHNDNLCFMILSVSVILIVKYNRAYFNFFPATHQPEECSLILYGVNCFKMWCEDKKYKCYYLCWCCFMMRMREELTKNKGCV